MTQFQIYESYRADTIFIAKLSKGHNSVKNVGRVTVLFLCTSSDGGLYFYMKIFWMVPKLKRGQDFHQKKNLKGNNSIKNVGGVSVLILCTSSDDGLYLSKFHENILKGIRVTEWT